MSLILNLAGGIQEIQKASTNKEKMEAISRTSEEFFRTLGILFYIRYLGCCRSIEQPIDEDIFQLVQNHFSSPTFGKWIKLQELCREELMEMGDTYTLSFNNRLNESLDARSSVKARKILEEIQKLKNNYNYSAPRHIQKIKFIEQIRLDRNRRSHHWDDNKKLIPLIKSDIGEFLVQLIEEVFRDQEIEILKIISIKLDSIEVLWHEKTTERKLLPKSDVQPELDKIYIRFDPNEDPFLFGTKLIYFDDSDDRIYVYNECDGKKTIYENVPLVGAYNDISFIFPDLLANFGLTKSESPNDTNLLTLSQKFREIKIINHTINNLPEIPSYYVKREELEKKLIQKLLHRRHETTTLNGGGGFGKTELAKKVIWDIIYEECPDEILKELKFDYVIWISGKITYFEYGEITDSEQTFSTLEDLLDCILYITNHADLIKNPLDYKKAIVITILSKIKSCLLVLDNLETVSERKEIWDYFDELSHEVPTNLKIIVTTRVSGDYPYQILNVEPMKDEEARILILEQLEQFDIESQYGNDDSIKEIIRLSAGSPLLILYIVQLLSTGYNISELKNEHSTSSYDKVLNFICKYQWDELSLESQKLLIAISIAGGKISFAQAKTLCSFNDSIFQEAKENLKKRSFVIGTELVNSILAILPPINRFVSNQSYSYPDIESELKQRWKWINKGDSTDAHSRSSSVLDSEEIALRQIFQNADRLIRIGAISEAYNWYQQAISQFPESHLAWRTIGDFEFKHIDDEKGRQSFKKSAELNPNDYVTFTNLAFWEAEVGRNKGISAFISRSIALNEQALKLAPDDANKKIITDHIAQSLLGIAIMEIKRTQNKWNEKKTVYAIAEGYIDKAINLTQNNFYSDPKSSNEIIHNVIDHSILAKAFLEKAKRYPEKKLREYYHQLALINICQGLKLKDDNTKILYLLGDYNIIRLLREEYYVVYDELDDNIISKIKRLEEKIDENIMRLKP